MQGDRNNIKFTKNKVVVASIILIALIVAMLVVIPGIIGEQNYINGVDAINREDYKQAIKYLEKSNTNDAAELIESIKYHLEAIEAYEEHNYKNAFEAARLVSEAYPKYDEVQKLYSDALKKLCEEILNTAKGEFNNGEYIHAYNSLKKVFTYDPNYEEALQLKDLYKERSEVMEAQLEEGGFFLVDSNSIKQREMVNINQWNTAGYTGKGITILHDDTGDTMHSLNCADIIQTILPDARVLRGSISGTTSNEGGVEASVTCYTTGDDDMPFDDFIEKYNVNLINNSTAGSDSDSESRWSSFMREKIEQYNLVCFGAAGNKGKMSNRFYGAFIMVSGVYLKNDGSIMDYGMKGDVDYSMFMGYQSGTSYASPFLCGMAGLLRSKYPDMTQEEIYQYFKDHSMDLGTEGKNPEYGWGLPILGDPEE